MHENNETLGYYYEGKDSRPGNGQYTTPGWWNNGSLADEFKQCRVGMKHYGWTMNNIGVYSAPEKYATREESAPIFEGLNVKSRIISLMIENENNKNKNKENPGAQVLKNAQKVYGIPPDQIELEIPEK